MALMLLHFSDQYIWFPFPGHAPDRIWTPSLKIQNRPWEVIKTQTNSKFTVFNSLYTMNRKFKRYPPEKDPNADVPKSNEQRENTSELLTLICQVKDARVVLYTIDEVVYFEVGRPIPDRL